jgi:hypothetical protein
VDSNRLRAVKADAGSSELQGTDLRLYLDRLIEQLDDSSVRATLKLMIWESRGAIARQEGLIALERLGGRDTTARMGRLRELRSVQDDLMAVYTGRLDVDDDFATQDGEASQVAPPGAKQPVRSAAPCTATTPLPCAFTKLAATTVYERGADTGRIPVTRLQAEPACAQPASIRPRQSRHASRAAR